MAVAVTINVQANSPYEKDAKGHNPRIYQIAGNITAHSSQIACRSNFPVTEIQNYEVEA